MSSAHYRVAPTAMNRSLVSLRALTAISTEQPTPVGPMAWHGIPPDWADGRTAAARAGNTMQAGRYSWGQSDPRRHLADVHRSATQRLWHSGDGNLLLAQCNCRSCTSSSELSDHLACGTASALCFDHEFSRWAYQGQRGDRAGGRQRSRQRIRHQY